MSLARRLRYLEDPDAQRRLEGALSATQQVAATLISANDSDPFAAAVRAEHQLRDNRSIRPGVYGDPESQRVFSEAWCILDQISRTARESDQRGGKLDRYFALVEERDRHRALLGDSPQAALRRANDAEQEAEQGALWRLLHFWGTLGPTGFLVLSGALLGEVGGPLVFAGALCGIFALHASWLLARAKRRRMKAKQATRDTQRAADQLASFSADPERGGYLRELQRAHPALPSPPSVPKRGTLGSQPERPHVDSEPAESGIRARSQASAETRAA